VTADPHEDKPLTRLQYAAPHLGSILAFLPAAIGAGVLSLGYFHPVFGILLSMLVAASPVIGARVVMDLQGRKADWRGATLYPYVWWSVVALGCFGLGMMISWWVYPGVDAPNEAWSAVDSWLDAAGVLQLIGIGIAFCVPVLRFIMWMIKPPPQASQRV
jgi:hypothetical protein